MPAVKSENEPNTYLLYAQLEKIDYHPPRTAVLTLDKWSNPEIAISELERLKGPILSIYFRKLGKLKENGAF